MQEMRIRLNDVKIAKKGKSKGKRRKQAWRAKKRKSIYLAYSYYRLGMEGKGANVMRCGDKLVFERIDENTIRLHRAELCRDRLCPICVWRRSLKIFGQVSKIMDYMNEHYDYKYIFLTFTVKNMAGKELLGAVDMILKAFKLMIQRKEFKKISKGWFRALEVTHSWKRGDDYHPHIHMVMAVNKSYFDSGASGYMKHDDWMNLWRSCTDLDYDPWVDVRRVKSDDDIASDGNISYTGAVAEIAKYTVKDNDYVIDQRTLLQSVGLSDMSGDMDIVKRFKMFFEEQMDEVVWIMHSALSGRRLMSFGGKLKEAHKLLNLDDPEDGDLTDIDGNDEVRKDLKQMIEVYKWNVVYGDYFLVALTAMEIIDRGGHVA